MRKRAYSEAGQASVEYALVLSTFLCVVLALAALWHFARSGKIQQLARAFSSHNAEGDATEFAQDLLVY